MFGLEPHIIVFDTEYTTWEGAMERKWSGPGEYQEIVQISAIQTETAAFKELDSITLFVKPVKNPVLSDFFTALTGITQQVVDEEGMPYAEALQLLSEWSEDLRLYAWGGDPDVMKKNAELLGVPFPFEMTRFGNIKDIFEAQGIRTKKYTSGTIPRAFDAEPPPHAHDALNDARSILQGLRLLKKSVESNAN